MGIHTLPVSKRVLGYPYNIPNTMNIPQDNRHKMKRDHESFTRKTEPRPKDREQNDQGTKVEEQDIGQVGAIGTAAQCRRG